MAITYRVAKGSALTYAKLDANFSTLDAGKANLSGAAFSGAVSAPSVSSGPGSFTTLSATRSGQGVVATFGGGTQSAYVYSGDGVAYFAAEAAIENAIAVRAGGGVAIYVAGAQRGLFSSTGLAVTGTLSATGMTLDAGGNLLVGTAGGLLSGGSRVRATSSSMCLDIQETGISTVPAAGIWHTATSGDNKFVEYYTEGTATLRGSIDYNRGGGVVRYNTTSDLTFKNLIGDASQQKSLDILASTKLREYSWKDDETNKSQIGVIAQELYETFKGAVSVGGEYEETVPAVTEQRLVTEVVLDEEGNEVAPAVYETVEITPETTVTKYRPWAVDKTAFTFHLIAGYQAQQAQIASLEARLSALEQA